MPAALGLITVSLDRGFRGVPVELLVGLHHERLVTIWQHVFRLGERASCAVLFF
jgi:hypothetical protein